MDPKLQQLVARTNLDELLAPSAPEVDLNQPVAPPASAPMDPARSTADPFQVNFATTDVIGKLHDGGTSSGVRWFALVFLGGPMLIFGLSLLYLTWYDPQLQLFKIPNDLGSALKALFGTAAGLAIGGFWPYVIFRRRPAATDKT
ncbi:hypothetical protein [Lysobacter sp. cf310]|uniref:hypothetical protein n=1 Tax=Lysobacter sp. cf310 TaxID=1761790 RepID=UPI0008F05FA2|nr:hypothetical protein [Lysobacter sp. cf310]SFK68844.1 hypothetical protein SAMN04487938_1620 [Lysobacter sp. cf310]